MYYHDVLINVLYYNAQSADSPCSTLTICLKIFMASSKSYCDKYLKAALPASTEFNLTVPQIVLP